MNFLTLWQFDVILRGTECLGHLVFMNMISVHSEDSDLSKDIYGEQDEQDGDPAGNPSNTTDSYLQSVFSFSCFI